MERQRTLDGSWTVYSPQHAQTYGSRHGAATQAREVFLSGSGTAQHPAPAVLEVGFGLGQNFRVTLQDTLRRGVPLQYLAYEQAPVDEQTLREVSADDPLAQHPVWQQLLTRWGGPLQIGTPALQLELRCADVTTVALPCGWASAVYLDGFSPACNPEVWTPDFLARLAATLRPGGVLATYSAAGRVRRGLMAAGLQVQRCRGPAGKREVLRAIRPV
ncbi:tRNA (5-methylaminomethyl-2-thiouridine)(34)-methyltransferase MnmD [Deinococcus sonorensis]|uniref:tRNA (5-methylaminomethyl-2-thiouridine)(34)-methyltransferase MnmD n=2 Tax=Deinococcus sonorensis TaxID=309891 RepID=A0AAU7U7A7_9DEIO